MDSYTIRKLNQYLGIDSGELLTDNTWKALGKLLKLSGPFAHSNRHNRALQRHIKTPYGLVTGKWFDTETKTFDRGTTLRLQQFLEKTLP